MQKHRLILRRVPLQNTALKVASKLRADNLKSNAFITHRTMHISCNHIHIEEKTVAQINCTDPLFFLDEKRSKLLSDVWDGKKSVQKRFLKSDQNGHPKENCSSVMLHLLWVPLDHTNWQLYKTAPVLHYQSTKDNFIRVIKNYRHGSSIDGQVNGNSVTAHAAWKLGNG